METKEIEKLIECFGGRVLSLDLLPAERVECPWMCVYNSEPSHDLGRHWLALACVNRNGKRVVLHLDSLGLVPILEPVLNFINANIEGELVTNAHALQSPTSSTCGLYAVLFLHWIESGGDYDSFLRAFSASPEENDAKITRLFARADGIKAKSECEQLSEVATSSR
jgi:hypothetical protein